MAFFVGRRRGMVAGAVVAGAVVHRKGEKKAQAQHQQDEAKRQEDEKKYKEKMKKMEEEHEKEKKEMEAKLAQQQQPQVTLIVLSPHSPALTTVSITTILSSSLWLLILKLGSISSPSTCRPLLLDTEVLL